MCCIAVGNEMRCMGELLGYISGVEGVSQCYFDGGFQLLWVKVACGSVSKFIVVSYLLL